MKFKHDFIERVAEANNIVDIISQHTQLKSAGGGLMGRCPFPDHPEKTPSFSVSDTKQVYHCFGCHKKGNIFTFLHDYNGMSFPEAVEYLANRAGIALPIYEKTLEESDVYKEKKRALQKANTLAAHFFVEQLKRQSPESPVKKYLAKRKLTQETVETFQIGYAPAEWDSLEKFFTQKNISLSVAEEARLLRARSEGKSGFYDLFRDRLMFPIVSPMGEPIAFGGRIIEQGEPKYLNSPETILFVKGRILYGIYQTAKYIRAEDSALIVEGYMDLVSLYQSGIKNVVATMGTALTIEHSKIIKRLTKNVVALFDGDSAGIEAAERSLPILLAADLHPKGLTLPEGMDPDDFVNKYGADFLKQELQKAPDLFMMVLDRWMRDFKGEASDKIKLIDKLKPIFTAIIDPRLTDLYLQEVATLLSVSHLWLKQALFQKNTPSDSSKRFDNTQTLKPTPAAAIAPATSDLEIIKYFIKTASKAELMLLELTLKSRANFEFFQKENLYDYIINDGTRKILHDANEVYRQSPDKFDKLTSLLVNVVDQPDLLFASENAIKNSEEFEMRLLKDCFLKIKDSFLKERAKKLALELKTSLNNEPQEDKLQEIMAVQKNRMTLNKGN